MLTPQLFFFLFFFPSLSLSLSLSLSPCLHHNAWSRRHHNALITPTSLRRDHVDIIILWSYRNCNVWSGGHHYTFNIIFCLDHVNIITCWSCWHHNDIIQSTSQQPDHVDILRLWSCRCHTTLIMLISRFGHVDIATLLIMLPSQLFDHVDVIVWSFALI